MLFKMYELCFICIPVEANASCCLLQAGIQLGPVYLQQTLDHPHRLLLVFCNA